MSGDLLLVLLLATGVGQADKKPGTEHAAVAAEAQVKAEAVRGQKEDVQAKKKVSQKGAAAAQAETNKAQGRTEAAPVKREAVRGQKQEAQAKTKAAQEGTAKAPAETKKAEGRTEVAQVKTEAGPGQAEEAQAQTEEPQAQTDKDPKLTSVPGGNALGMSILGNQEAPTSLVIVPWKSSEMGRSPGISPMLDDSRRPVDKEVFMRELRYYEIRSEKKP